MLNVPFLDLLKTQMYNYVNLYGFFKPEHIGVLCPLFIKLIGIELFTTDTQYIN